MSELNFTYYENQFNALADKKRLEIIHELTKNNRVCVGDMCNSFGLKQSKLSYHLKVLLDANLILKETVGTRSYYKLNEIEMNNILSEKLCCIFRICPKCK